MSEKDSDDEMHINEKSNMCSDIDEESGEEDP